MAAKKGPVETTLTPELAARLLAKQHPRQRRAGNQSVAKYARAMANGEWRLVPDPIMVDPEGQLFNGTQRCMAVVSSRRDVPVYIMWDADPSLFDLIDTGRARSAFQFVGEPDAALRASAARILLWYQRSFEQPLSVATMRWTLHEVLRESDARRDAFDAMRRLARKSYDYTSLSSGVALAAYALAYEQGFEEEVGEFVEGLVDPQYLAADDPRRVLAERFRRQEHRTRNRQPIEDWTLLVRALNLFLEGRTVTRLAMSPIWPHVGEAEAAFRRREQNAIAARAVETERPAK